MSEFLKNTITSSIACITGFGILRPFTNFTSNYTISERLSIENYKPIQGSKLNIYTQYYEKIKRYKGQIEKDIPNLSLSSVKADRDKAVLLQVWCEQALKKNFPKKSTDIQENFSKLIKYCTMNIKNQLAEEGIRLIKNSNPCREDAGYKVSFRKNKKEIIKKELAIKRGIGVIKGSEQLKKWCEEALERPYRTYQSELYKLSKTWCTKKSNPGPQSNS